MISVRGAPSSVLTLHSVTSLLTALSVTAPPPARCRGRQVRLVLCCDARGSKKRGSSPTAGAPQRGKELLAAAFGGPERHPPRSSHLYPSGGAGERVRLPVKRLRKVGNLGEPPGRAVTGGIVSQSPPSADKAARREGSPMQLASDCATPTVAPPPKAPPRGQPPAPSPSSQPGPVRTCHGGRQRAGPAAAASAAHTCRHRPRRRDTPRPASGGEGRGSGGQRGRGCAPTAAKGCRGSCYGLSRLSFLVRSAPPVGPFPRTAFKVPSPAAAWHRGPTDSVFVLGDPAAELTLAPRLAGEYARHGHKQERPCLWVTGDSGRESQPPSRQAVGLQAACFDRS